MRRGLKLAFMMPASRSSLPQARPGQPQGGGRDTPPLLEDLPVPQLLRACRQLGIFWSLGPETMADLLGTSRTTWFRWLEAAEASAKPLLTPDQRARAVALLRIFEAAGELNQTDDELRSWPSEPLSAPGFKGQTPLATMLAGFEGLLLVRDYLNFLVGSWN